MQKKLKKYITLGTYEWKENPSWRLQHNRSLGRGLRNENCDDDEQRQYSFTYLVILFLLFTARNIIFSLQL